MASWEEYAALIAARRDERVRGAATASGRKASAAEMNGHADQLAERLDHQAAALFEAARALRVRAPEITGLEPPAPPVAELLPPDIAAQRLTEVAGKIDEADALALEAHPSYRPTSDAPALPGPLTPPPASGRPGRPGRPVPEPTGRTLPGGAPRPPARSGIPTARNFLVYLAAAALTVVAQFVTFARNPDPSWANVLFLQPAVGFLLGWFLLLYLDRSRPRGARGSQPRLGLILCLLAGPLGGLLVVLT